MNIKIINCNSK